MRLRYRNKITLDRTQLETFKILTDLSDEYETAWITKNSNTPIGDWWQKQHQSDLRIWQKETIRDLKNYLFEDLTPLMVYKRGHGYSQPHDIALAYSEQDKVWVFMTERNTWITQNGYANFTLNVEDAMGPVTDRATRDELWQLIE